MTTPSFSIPLTEPTANTPRRRYDFNHIPKLGPAWPSDRRGSLLPKEGGRPGLTYAQVPLKYVRQFEDWGWLPMHDTCRYTIVGPKGSIDMELMATGQPVDGVASGSVQCVCVVPTFYTEDGERIDVICEATGLDPKTGFPPEPGAQQEAVDGQETQDAGPEDGSESEETEPQDREGEGGGPEPHTGSGRRKGRGHTEAP